MYKLIHNECGKIAFYLTEKPQFLDDIKREMVRDFDGNIPLSGDYITCFSCNGYINRFNENNIEELDWTDWFIID